MSSIVVIGGCITDLISYVSRFPRPGETIAGTSFHKGCGGKAANQCVMSKKLGASTAMIAKLGEDLFGHEHFDNFQNLKIDTKFVTFSKTSQTSTAAITVTSDGQNNIIYVPGAIMDLTPSDILSAESLIKEAKVLLCTYESPLDTLFTAFSLARKYGVKTVLNAAPAADPSYEKLYPLVDFICVNEIEAEDATDLKLKTLSDVPVIIDCLIQKGCSTVILTLGSKGAAFQTQSDTKSTFVATRQVSAVDCTGAGDAFMGSFVYFLSEYPQLSLQAITERACEIATLSVLRKGTQTSFPEREEIPADIF